MKFYIMPIIVMLLLMPQGAHGQVEDKVLREEKNLVIVQPPAKTAEGIESSAKAMELAVQNKQMMASELATGNGPTLPGSDIPDFNVQESYATGMYSSNIIDVVSGNDSIVIADTPGTPSSYMYTYDVVDLNNGSIVLKSRNNPDLIYRPGSSGYADRLANCLGIVLRGQEQVRNRQDGSEVYQNLLSVESFLNDMAKREGMLYGTTIPTGSFGLRDTIYLFKKGNTFAVVQKLASGLTTSYKFESSGSDLNLPVITVTTAGANPIVKRYRPGEEGFVEALNAMLGSIDAAIVAGNANEFFGRISSADEIRKQLRKYRI